MHGSTGQAEHLTVRRSNRFYWRNVDEVLVVIDLSTLEFTILNKTASLIWLSLLDTEWSLAGLVRFVSETFSMGHQSPQDDVMSLLEQWNDLGWLEKRPDEKLRILSTTLEPSPPPYKQISLVKLNASVSRATLEWSKTMDFIGKPVTVDFYCDPGLLDSDVSSRAKAFLNGLPVESTEQRSDAPIQCFVTQDGIFLRLGSTCVQAMDVSDGLSRLVLWCFYQAYGRDRFLGTFHAAALGRAHGAILMPGVSGVGKSTLTAYLSRNGWNYGGDDIIGLSKPQGPANEYHVLPFCSAVSVKEGSLPILSGLYPGIEDLPLVQYDTKAARFPSVPVDNQMTSDLNSRTIKAIVFPAYDKATKTNLVALTTEDALLSLVGVGFRTGEVMNEVLLDDLFQFLETTPKYRLEFSSIQDAQQRLEALL